MDGELLKNCEEIASGVLFGDVSELVADFYAFLRADGDF
jgi:hypothetical protein